MSALAELELAKTHHREGRLEEAARGYGRILAQNPDDADARHLLGVVALEKGQSEAALEHLRHALAVRPGFPRAKIHLGVCLQALGRLEEAQRALADAAREDPSLADAHFNHGNVLYALGRLEEAAAAYRQAAALEPGSADAHLNLGNALRALGRLGDAREAFERAAQAGPRFAPAHFNLGLVLAQTGATDAALEALRRAAELEPRLAEAHERIGRLLALKGDAPGAEAAYLRAVELKPGLAEAQLGLARLWFGARDPRAVHAQYNAAEALLARGEPRAALPHIESNLKLVDHKTRALAAKLIAHLALGDTDAARPLIDFAHQVRSLCIDTPPGYADLDAFNADLARYLDEACAFATAPRDAPELRYRQSDEILRYPEGPVAVLKVAIERAVEAYRQWAASAPVPFPSGVPERYDLQGWGVLMEGHGYKDPHFHPGGWLSGTYYVQAPGSADGGAHAGWLELGRPDPKRFRLPMEPPVHLFEPRPGRLVLFPSWLYHRTLPFAAGARRLSFAFDVLPSWDGSHG